MKTFFIFFLMVSSICASAQNRKDFYKEAKISLTKPIQSDSLKYEDEKVSFNFFPIHDYDGYYYIEVEITNKTDNRLYIEWENARINGSKVVFSEDRKLFMNNKKEDEVVVGGEKSEKRKILPIKNVGDNGIHAIFDDSQKMNMDIPIIIPIKREDTINDYKFTISFSKYSESEIDSMFAIKKKYYALSKQVKKKMTLQQVVDIMGQYDDTVYMDVEGKRIFCAIVYPYVDIWFDQDGKVSSIQKDDFIR